jgi:hypothetical protein
MALPETLNSREQKKFNETDNGEVAVNVIDRSPFMAPAEADSGTMEYPNSTTVIVKYRSGGVSGTVLKTITLVYTNASKQDLASWAVS